MVKKPKTSKGITAFYAPWCGNCRIVIPKLRAYARRKGYRFEKINVENCKTETCESIGYVPHVLMNGRPMSDKQLERILDG